MFFMCFGPIFFFIAISWNEACSRDEKILFLQFLWKETLIQGSFFCLVYAISAITLRAWSVTSDCKYNLLRLPVIMLMYFAPISTLILPFQFLVSDVGESMMRNWNNYFIAISRITKSE